MAGTAAGRLAQFSCAATGSRQLADILRKHEMGIASVQRVLSRMLSGGDILQTGTRETIAWQVYYSNAQGPPIAVRAITRFER